jgi:hypothetical protein
MNRPGTWLVPSPRAPGAPRGPALAAVGAAGAGSARLLRGRLLRRRLVLVADPGHGEPIAVESDRIRGAELTAEIELVSRDDLRVGDRVPLYACGDPTINVRMLLQESD